MAQLHRLSFVALIVAMALPVAAQASTPGSQQWQSSGLFTVAYDDETNDGQSSRAKNRGVVGGEVAEIDYGRGVIMLQTQHRGKIEIVVSPSTSIFDRENDYGTISDIARGSRVSVFISEVDGRLVAQIIHIR